MEQTITQKEAQSIVKNYKDSQFFTVTFVKRSNGEIRKINCRKGVVKHSKGGSLRFNPSNKNLVSVFDVAIGKYRFISLENIRRIAMKGQVYDVK